MNRAMIIGRLGRDPESKVVGNEGNMVCNFSVATSSKWKDGNGEQREKTEWHRCVAWGRLAEICSTYLHKGKQVYVEGEIETEQWEKDGVTRYTTKIKVKSIEMLGSRSDGQNQNSNAQQSAQQSAQYSPNTGINNQPAPEEQDDLPF